MGQTKLRKFWQLSEKTDTPKELQLWLSGSKVSNKKWSGEGGVS